MITFDDILPAIKNVFEQNRPFIKSLGDMLVNRDLNGRVRLILSEQVKEIPDFNKHIQHFLSQLIQELSPHIWSAEQAVLFEEDIQAVCANAPSFELEGFACVRVIDRLATETEWSSFTEVTSQPPRIVFFSIKGGVGRSSALAATAWSLAEAGKRVLVLDLDLESPGLSTSLLPETKQPAYGITDWLVEDLVDNANTVFENMVASSDLSRDGEIYVVPAHGADAGEYVSKLGRVWMPKFRSDGTRVTWSERLQRLIDDLEKRYQPDVVLIDSRAGIDEVASSCVTDLGASLVLLFAIEGTQTWNGYRIIFDYWRRMGVIRSIRERLQIVAALTPEVDQIDYLQSLQDRAYTLFAETQYDSIPPGETAIDRWHFESADETAPHYPWVVNWHRSFAGLHSLHGRLVEINAANIQAIFGSLTNSIMQTINMEVSRD